MIIVEIETNDNFIELYGKYVLDMLCKALSVGWTTDIRSIKFIKFISSSTS